MYATHPEMAKRWEKETPKGKKLPKYAKKKKRKKRGPTRNRLTINAGARPAASADTSGSDSLRADPTRTATLRRQFHRELRQVYAQVKLDLLRLVVEQDVFNDEWGLLDPAGQLDKFGDWLYQHLETGFDAIVQNNILAAAGKGMGRSYQDVSNQRRAPTLDLSYGRGRKDGFVSSLARKNQKTIALLAARALHELYTINARLVATLARRLADEMTAQSESLEEMARDMTDAIQDTADGLGLFVHTETIRAYAEGQLDALEDLDVKLVDVDAEMILDTADDRRVCALCHALEGQPLTVSEARGRIPLHPGCRCRWRPVL